MSLSTNIEETEIPKLGKHSHINSDGNLSTGHTSSTSGLYGNAGRIAAILRKPDCVFHKRKQVPLHTKSSIPILLLIFLLGAAHQDFATNCFRKTRPGRTR